MVRTPANDDTIVAVSSAAGRAARGIVRLSGPECIDYARRLLVPSNRDISFRTYHAFSAELSLEDCALPCRVYVMRSPASYTREDVVEFHTFGNPALLEALMLALQKMGARAAQPGEFTRRAFLNGRLDLAQAEAVEALIHARDEDEFKAAQETLGGALSRQVNAVREELAQLAALVELSMDFTDHDVEIIPHGEAVRRLKPISDKMQALAARSETGRVRSQGVRVVLFGPPNAGKSKLFNAILASERAIVSPHPGTTRDTIEASFELNGVEITLADTAGIRATADEVESAAVRRSRSSLTRADIPLCVLDAASELSEEAREAVASLPLKKGLVILNKMDLCASGSAIAELLPKGTERIEVSAKTGEGVQPLLARISEVIAAGKVERSAANLMVTARQSELLLTALDAILRGLAEKQPLMELLADDMREALRALGELTGDVADNVLDRIFSQFCIGK